jgi:hypothetical protein
MLPRSFESAWKKQEEKYGKLAILKKSKAVERLNNAFC